MKKVTNNTNNSKDKSLRPALNPEARENQLIALAIDRAEEQLRNGTASSQLIVHYLKLAATKEKTKLENELLKAKINSLEASDKSGELYENAIKAFATYSGNAMNIRDDDSDL